MNRSLTRNHKFWCSCIVPPAALYVEELASLPKVFALFCSTLRTFQGLYFKDHTRNEVERILEDNPQNIKPLFLVLRILVTLLWSAKDLEPKAKNICYWNDQMHLTIGAQYLAAATKVKFWDIPCMNGSYSQWVSPTWEFTPTRIFFKSKS